jgi:hypothetical protein
MISENRRGRISVKNMQSRTTEKEDQKMQERVNQEGGGLKMPDRLQSRDEDL